MSSAQSNQGIPSGAFEGYLMERTDAVEGAVCELLAALNVTAVVDGTQPDVSNMAIVGPILESVQSTLLQLGYESCWPYYDDEVPCAELNSCKNGACPLRATGNKHILGEQNSSI